jgi:predicted Rossmann fold nucleotide-binding protein DprA/Smf involved in DNA uptake
MSLPVSEQTKAILLLTSPLIVGKPQRDGPKILTPTEYNKLASRLMELKRQPVDLLGNERDDLVHQLADTLDSERLFQLLDRGLLMSQAIDQWQSRGIWIVSRADAAYPRRLKAKLKQQAPAILFGCGDRALLEQGGLGIVGSRKVDDAISEFVENAARLASNSGYSVVSGGAKGVDQIAMRSALDVEGTVVGALAENLNRAVVSSQYRNALRSHSLVLISAVDPSAGFNVGNAMARNKLIYALSDAGLVANADYEKGGTWAGAIEQINRFNCCPVYVRTTERTPKGNKALIERGAHPWPNPTGMTDFRALLEKPPKTAQAVEAQAQELDFNAEPAVTETKVKPQIEEKKEPTPPPIEKTVAKLPSEEIFDAAKQAMLTLLQERAMNETDLTDALGVVKSQTRAWLEILLQEGLVEKTKRPVRYKVNESQRNLF